MRIYDRSKSFNGQTVLSTEKELFPRCECGYIHPVLSVQILYNEFLGNMLSFDSKIICGDKAKENYDRSKISHELFMMCGIETPLKSIKRTFSCAGTRSSYNQT